jgi:WhiB family redox-sensing transcriptional regulator
VSGREAAPVSKHTSILTSRGQPPRATLNDWTWQRHGHCVGVPSEVFFPEEEERRQRRRREAQAKLICEGCPVLAACREHALRTPETYGVWGAMSPAERAQVLLRGRASTGGTIPSSA